MQIREVILRLMASSEKDGDIKGLVLLIIMSFLSDIGMERKTRANSFFFGGIASSYNRSYISIKVDLSTGDNITEHYYGCYT